MKTFDSVTYDDAAQIQQRDIKAAFEHLEDVLNRNFRVVGGGYASREMMHCMDRIQEASMWANREIRSMQIARNVAAVKKKGI